MTTFKPGDRVRSPLLVGEWEVKISNESAWATLMNDLGARADVPRGGLIPVAPPLPPEPDVGEVVWARGRYWMKVLGPHRSLPWLQGDLEGSTWGDWADIAIDAAPVVPITKATEWLNENYWRSDTIVSEFRAQFGWRS